MFVLDENIVTSKKLKQNTELKQIIRFKTENGLEDVKSDEELDTSHEMTYLILHHAIPNEENDDESLKKWEVVRGRQAVIDSIYTILKEYGTYEFISSNIISEKVTANKAVSAYTFIRKLFESGNINLDAWGIETIDDLDDYALSNNHAELPFDINTVEGLQKFYEMDLQHIPLNTIRAEPQEEIIIPTNMKPMIFNA